MKRTTNYDLSSEEATMPTLEVACHIHMESNLCQTMKRTNSRTGLTLQPKLTLKLEQSLMWQQLRITNFKIIIRFRNNNTSKWWMKDLQTRMGMGRSKRERETSQKSSTWQIKHSTTLWIVSKSSLMASLLNHSMKYPEQLTQLLRVTKSTLNFQLRSNLIRSKPWEVTKELTSRN